MTDDTALDWSTGASATTRLDLENTLTADEITARLAAMAVRPVPAENTPEAAVREVEVLHANIEHRTAVLNGSPAAMAKTQEAKARAEAVKIDAIVDGTYTPPTFAAVDENGLTDRDYQMANQWMIEDGYSEAERKQALRAGPVSKLEYDAAVELKRIRFGDPEWCKRFDAGDREAGVEFRKFSRIIAKGPKKEAA